jgi:hypothetical protein
MFEYLFGFISVIAFVIMFVLFSSKISTLENEVDKLRLEG